MSVTCLKNSSMCLSVASTGCAGTGAGPASKSTPAPGLVGMSFPYKPKAALSVIASFGGCMPQHTASVAGLQAVYPDIAQQVVHLSAL